jgi:cytochrome c5
MLLRTAILFALTLPLTAHASNDPGLSGQQVYETSCAVCHDKGINKAPKLGDKAKWKPLIAEGQRMLNRTAIKGIRGMPAKGGNPDLSELEVKRAVAYMANAAGGKFKLPD